ncbi:MAG: UDP-N-acetylglucosamine diphosphorylase/glucosamine-1-phosphate N-acetyltransferase [Gammaproteobacteria bacterium]|nr:UDP-N-acetylglucosamine diphosphorylase/glucosamine-1-phosphate N-acetyltransferase [Gammaproteobacteria bacterium]
MLEVIVLAAGKGTRMKSNLPKVLHPIAGKPMLSHVLGSARALNPLRLHLVMGHGSELVAANYGAIDVNLVLQEQQLGTGHAVLQALPDMQDDSIALVLYGDVPLIKAATLQRLLERVSENTMGLLTVNLVNPQGYGRILRDENGAVSAIVEQKDASAEQLQIAEVNTGLMAVRVADLQRWLPQLHCDNAQGEYYLTDIIAMARAEGLSIVTEQPDSENEVLGVNNRQQQAQLERFYQQQIASQLMTEGVTLLDPERFDCRGKLVVGSDVIIDINCVFEGEVNIGNNVRIGPNCVLINSSVADNCVIKANTILEEATIGADCELGPFARARPGTVMAQGAKLGNFVETKKANIGAGSKVNHLTYIGDADLGAGVNVGAGTITCNFDGVNKWQTTIGDGAFIGSNSSLVAPVAIGAGATVGAGSTITNAVPDHQLGVARGKQRNIDKWKKPEKQ